MSARPLWIGFFSVGALVLGPLLWIDPLGWFADEAQTGVEGVEVRRGPLSITVVERGNLEASNSVELKSEIEGQSTILFLIEEGSWVEEGDLLCELDATDLIDRRVQQDISVQNAGASFVKSKQQFEIQKSQNQSDVAAAERKLEFARTDLKKYLQGDWPKDKQSAEADILLAEEELSRSREVLDWSERLHEEGFLTRTQLEEDRLKHSRAQVQLDQKKLALKVMQEFDFPREKKRLEADVEEASRELERVKLQAAARLVDYQAAMETSSSMFDLQSENLAKIEAQIAKAKIYAPRAGMVVYAQEEGGRWGRDDPIAEGTMVRERQEIITIPDADGAMTAEASLHESVLQKVVEGQECYVRVDAIPDLQFRGRVAFKALLPDQNSWWANPNMRLYRTEIELLESSSEMRPGMSCEVEVLVDHLEDALHVPVQAVMLDAGQTICFVRSSAGTEARAVEVGQSNHKWTEIRSGLEEGEIVLLAPPPGYALRPSPATDASGDESLEPRGLELGSKPDGGAADWKAKSVPAGSAGGRPQRGPSSGPGR